MQPFEIKKHLSRTIEKINLNIFYFYRKNTL